MVNGRGNQDFYSESRVTINSNKLNNLNRKIVNNISDLRIYHQNIVTCLWHVATINVDSPDLTREFI
jgi:hypothetical protein